jgi:hypothetical protein
VDENQLDDLTVSFFTSLLFVWLIIIAFFFTLNFLHFAIATIFAYHSSFSLIITISFFVIKDIIDFFDVLKFLLS